MWQVGFGKRILCNYVVYFLFLQFLLHTYADLTVQLSLIYMSTEAVVGHLLTLFLVLCRMSNRSLMKIHV